MQLNFWIRLINFYLFFSYSSIVIYLFSLFKIQPIIYDRFNGKKCYFCGALQKVENLKHAGSSGLLSD